MKKYIISTLAFIMLILVGCSKNIQKYANNINYELESVSFEVVKSASNILEGIVNRDLKKILQIKISIKVNILNKNSIGIDINSIKYKVFINDRYIGDGEANRSIRIDPNSKTRIIIPFTVEINKLTESGIDILKLKRAKINIKGESIVDIKVGKLNVPFEIDGDSNKITIDSIDLI
jgi:LEA14-like dessication related protein